MTEQTICVHATCVALPDVDGGWSGVLLRGPSGAGKSDLALRMIDDGARLVADDQTELQNVNGAVAARAPETIAGKIEVRGLGILELPYLDTVALTLVCDLVAADQVVRHPDPGSVNIAGVALPQLALTPFEASAPVKLRLGVEAARRGIVGMR
ncbi:MAG: serine/threonine protein kinase [Rhodospirillaceae bacterium]|jgi:serine kinase of HPr protein (carbohydrate metabolism regulator)|nr:serine/threonine protein kinase [Rhodospirillaceae bacterium]MBT3930978.1 serine/threonine protein kinase [Rhodospirillaceae bacterium]MBT6309151.1 serine/threonine protein kinase [Rhodospirillaceae bacterium]